MILKNRVAWIVGGGCGLGRAIARTFAREGAELAVADINLEAARETLGLCQKTELALRVDISNPGEIEDAVSRVMGRFERLEILVNCAALCLVDPILELTPERWDKVFNVNARGAFFCMQAAARVMAPRRFGRIINITTPASRLGVPYFATYAASKAAVDSLTRSATIAWVRSGITVNTLSPGMMTGGMIDKLEVELARTLGRGEAEFKAARTDGLPMGRRVEPEEVAEAAVWRASAAAAYVSAERFNFTGGMELA
jgi:NAD(P)-dependent dehydrogenase (short-subunit alcohol dehydrogenase family)